MSQQLVPINKSQLPAHLRKGGEQARALTAELSQGVTSSFPIISYRGKVWRVRKSGEEVDFLDRRGNAIPSIDVVMVKSNPMPSKTYYASKYEAGASEAPDCSSSDGLRPDASVQNPQHTACASCPQNAWGSRMTEAGKKGRACSDVRRMAVVFADELRKKGRDAHLFLMRIPPASLNPLKDYAEKVLGPAGLEYFAVVTQLGFDSTAAHPKLTFRVATDDDDAVRFLTEEEYEAVLELRDSDEAQRILSEEPDYADAGTTGGDKAAGGANAPQTATPAPASAPPRQRARPVDEEDVPVKAATLPAAAAEEEDEDEDEDEDEPVVVAPPPVVKAKKKRAAPAPAEQDDPAPTKGTAAPVPPKGSKDPYADILENLLGK
jgi:hypothetical protein